MSFPKVIGAGGGGGGDDLGAITVDEVTLTLSGGTTLATKAGGIGGTQIAAAIKDPAAATPGLRTLGTGSAQAAAGDDSRLTNARAPTTHAASHQPGGSDAMAVDAIAATGSLRTLGTGAQQAASGTDSRFTDSRTPTTHAVSHRAAGSDEIDGDRIDIDWAATNYTPATVTETTAVTDLSSHLKGIDNAINPELCQVFQFGHVPSDNQIQLCKIPLGWKVSALKHRATHAGVAGTFTATKDSDGTTPAAGTTQLSSSFAATTIATANTLYSSSLTATGADLVHGNADNFLALKWASLDLSDQTQGAFVFVYFKRV